MEWCEGEISAILKAFGLSVSLWGLANVLQCAGAWYKHSIPL